jgi:hypothetical protein
LLDMTLAELISTEGSLPAPPAQPTSSESSTAKE